MFSGASGFFVLCDYFNSYEGVYTSYAKFWLVATHLNPLALSAVMLFLKSDKDILQGVRKLDNLLKVSYFQKYKK